MVPCLMDNDNLNDLLYIITQYDVPSLDTLWYGMHYAVSAGSCYTG